MSTVIEKQELGVEDQKVIEDVLRNVKHERKIPEPLQIKFIAVINQLIAKANGRDDDGLQEKFQAYNNAHKDDDEADDEDDEEFERGGGSNNLDTVATAVLSGIKWVVIGYSVYEISKLGRLIVNVARNIRVAAPNGVTVDIELGNQNEAGESSGLNVPASNDSNENGKNLS